MTTTFITGANKGLGYETARRLIGQPYSVALHINDHQPPPSGGV